MVKPLALSQNPTVLLQSWQWWRLLWSPVLHADEMHLFYNMSSLLWKVRGSAACGDVVFLRLVQLVTSPCWEVPGLTGRLLHIPCGLVRSVAQTAAGVG